MRGYIELRTNFSDGTSARTIIVRYIVVNASSAYNLLLGRPSLNRLGAVASMTHMKLNFPSLEGGVITIRSDQNMAQKCYESSLKNKRGTYSITIQVGVPKGIVEAGISNERRHGPVAEVQKREIKGKKFRLDTSLCKEFQYKIAEVISKHMDAFVWSSADMPEIDPEFLCHKLTMDEKVRLVYQRRRNFNEDKRMFIKEETRKLLNVDHIREIQYPEWLANVVLVRKASGKWRICIDFTDLNKSCPKDSYPLPSIDSLVDSASSCQLLSFMDAFLGYNQIRMHPWDESKIVFMAEFASYCYKIMPFGLKNVGATYQRLMDRILAPMLGRNVQAYVDDMVVTSVEKDQHIVDLEQLFTTIAKYNLKLNLEKCVFEEEAGKFLRFLLTERGIEVNPNKCATIIGMRSPAKGAPVVNWMHGCPISFLVI